MHQCLFFSKDTNLMDFANFLGTPFFTEHLFYRAPVVATSERLEFKESAKIISKISIIISKN